MSSKRPVDLKYGALRSALSAEAAEAYLLLNEEYAPEVVLWETMIVAGNRNRVLNSLVSNPGMFIAALYNCYGSDEYPGWLSELRGQIDHNRTVDQQR